jgi:hypothetical protein
MNPEVISNYLGNARLHVSNIATTVGRHGFLDMIANALRWPGTLPGIAARVPRSLVAFVLSGHMHDQRLKSLC